MKTNMTLKTLGLAAAMAASTGAFAHWDDNASRFGFPGHPAAFKQSLELSRNVNDRQDRQLERILARFHEGRLTPAEFRKLMDEQTDIRKMERRFMADGFLDRHEFDTLDDALDAASRHIFREAHDVNGRPGYGYGYRTPYYGPAPWNR